MTEGLTINARLWLHVGPLILLATVIGTRALIEWFDKRPKP